MIFNNEPIGMGHLNGAIRLPESVNLLKVSDGALSLYKKFIQSANDQIYGLTFGKVNGSETAWAAKLGLNHAELRATLDELIQIGLVESRPEGIFITNYKMFVQGSRQDRDEFLSQIKGVK